MASRILIIDDEPKVLTSFFSLMADEGYDIATASSAEEGTKLTSLQSFDVILLDVQLPGRSGIEFLRELRTAASPPLVLVISGQADIPTALEAVRLGAVDFLEKPVPPEKLLTSVRSALMLATANRQRNLMVEDIDERSQITGKSKAVKQVLKAISHVAPTNTTVLITGPNGTGKELIATRIFLASGRRDRPLIRVNCPGIPETLFESELFGHARGAFTGAVKDFPGKFAGADGGTLFLDEVGDLPISCQAKLLRVLETGEVEKLGADETRKVDTRIICATNRNLSDLVAEGKFRQDLYYRISVFVIEAPPLAARREDIPLLVGEFLKQFDPSGRTTLSADALAYLTTLDYPGNVRQLKNIIERLSILCCEKAVQADDVISQCESARGVASDSENPLGLADKLALFEKELIAATLTDCDGNISEAARLLQVNRANLSRKIKELGLKNP
jgi:DNA-binding NtrC family response regulator